MSVFEQIVLGVLLADFLSGVFHWIEDQYGDPSLPILGPVFAANELHHIDPLDFTRGSFFRRNLTTWLIAAVIGVSLYFMFGLSVLLVTAVLAGAFANEIHVWAHIRPKNRITETLQAMGLLVPPHQHARHHRRPHARAYCVVTGFLNPILDQIRFWRALERLVPLTPKSSAT